MSFGYVGQFHFIAGAHWLEWTGQQTQSVPSFALRKISIRILDKIMIKTSK